MAGIGAGPAGDNSAVHASPRDRRRGCGPAAGNDPCGGSAGLLAEPFGGQACSEGVETASACTGGRRSALSPAFPGPRTNGIGAVRRGPAVYRCLLSSATQPRPIFPAAGGSNGISTATENIPDRFAEAFLHRNELLPGQSPKPRAAGKFAGRWLEAEPDDRRCAAATGPRRQPAGAVELSDSLHRPEARSVNRGHAGAGSRSTGRLSPSLVLCGRLARNLSVRGGVSLSSRKRSAAGVGSQLIPQRARFAGEPRSRRRFEGAEIMSPLAIRRDC